MFENSLAFAKHLDAADKLAPFRDRFIIPEKNGTEQTYFLGNSLGLQPKTAVKHVGEIMQQWSQLGVEGFFHASTPWYHYHDRLTSTLSKIVGANPSEIVVMNQLSVNLHLMLVSFYRPQGKRRKILCEAKAFPSDQYVMETHLRFHGFDPAHDLVEVSPREGEAVIRPEDIYAAINDAGDSLALVLWGGVNYYTGQVFNMKEITAAAHEVGAKAGFDLAHAVGNIPLELHNWGADFACWCTYKYLNSGPGAVGGVYIHERHHNDPQIPRFAGWWGYEKNTRFKMEKGFVPMPGAEGWQLSTASMLLFATHAAALEIFEDAGVNEIFKKGRLLNNYLHFIINDINSKAGKTKIKVLTPANEHERGNQVSMFLPENGKEVFSRIREAGFFADWREPSVIRIAPAPLYNRFEEVYRFGQVLGSI